ncbi:MAG: hypothetical protein QXU32_11085 [Nitrososphaerales archaeon]
MRSQLSVKKRTRSVSYRIDASVLEELSKEAATNETSVNILVNQVLRKFIEFDRYQLYLGIIPVPKQLLIEMISKYDDREIKFMAERTFRILKDAVLFMRKERDFDAYLYVLGRYVKVAGIASDLKIDENRNTLVVQHDMGLKWSEFVKELLTIIIENLTEQRADFELTESSVILRIELPDIIQKQLTV